MTLSPELTTGGNIWVRINFSSIQDEDHFIKVKPSWSVFSESGHGKPKIIFTFIVKYKYYESIINFIAGDLIFVCWLFQPPTGGL